MRGFAARTAALVLTALSVLAGCGSQTPAADPGPHASAGDPGPHASAADPPASYYVSLGDSLSVGVQPNSAGVSLPTSHGYADQLYASLRRGHRGLRLVKFGCSGETTTTMIKGGICHYRGGSQLAAAASFLRAHAGRITLITIDIGANDLTAYLSGCQSSASPAAGAACLTGRGPAVAANLAEILTTVRAAAGSYVPIIGMTYYDPVLGQWRDGTIGHADAMGSEEVVRSYNQVLATVYHKYGVRVADVSGAFSSTDFSGRVTLPGIGAVPTNVAAVCRWTWECAPPPRGPNVHADTAGYKVIAQTFLQADS